MKKINLKKRAEQLKKDIPAIFLAMKDPKTPWTAKAMAFLTIAYAFSPIDLIPDFIPVIGCLDDLILLPIMVAMTVKLIPKEVLEKHKKAAEEFWSEEGTKKWYFALPIAAVWVVVIVLLVWKVKH